MQLLLFRRLIIYTRYMVPKRLSSVGVFLRKSKMYLHEVLKGSKKITENLTDGREWTRTKHLSSTNFARRTYRPLVGPRRFMKW